MKKVTNPQDRLMKVISEIEEKQKNKPKVTMTGQNGNVFVLIGICLRSLEEAGQFENAEKMLKEMMEGAQSYDEALVIMMKYCDVE